MRVFRLLLGIQLVLVALGGDAQAQALDINNLVVMISVVRNDGTVDQGAGILVKQRPQVSYVVTANHVVDGDNAEPRKLDVQLFDTRSRDATSFPARRLYTSRQLQNLDIAILEIHDRVDGVNVIHVPQVLTRTLANSLYQGDPKDLLGKSARMVGNGTSGIVHGWMVTDAKEVRTARDDDIEVKSDVFLPGTSGGAMIEERSRSIVGLVTSAAVDRCIGVPIRVVIDAVKKMIPDIDLTFNTQSEQLTVTDQLIQHGYSVNAAGLAQALGADDEQALRWFAQLNFAAPVIEAALRTRTRRGQKDVTAAQLYFEGLRGRAGAPWLTAMLDRRPLILDPNTRVDAQGYEESLINIAARASSEIGVSELLRAGAMPNGYQDLDGQRVGEPRFLVPFSPIVKDNQLDRGAQRRIIDALLTHGAIVPEPIAPWTEGGTLYGPITFDFNQLQEAMLHTFGAPLPVTPDLCAPANRGFPELSCATAQRLYGVDWRPVVAAIPRLFGDFRPPPSDGPDAPSFVVRYFLGADAQAGYFLVEELTAYSGYSVLQVDHDLKQLVLLRYSQHHYWKSSLCYGHDSIDFCWRRIALSRDATTGGYRTEFGETLPVSASCDDAERRSRARRAAVAPQPYTDPNPKVAECVNKIVSTPILQLTDQAAQFNVLNVLTLSPRDCVLAQMKNDLLVNPRAVGALEYTPAQARKCCNQWLGGAGGGAGH